MLPLNIVELAKEYSWNNKITVKENIDLFTKTLKLTNEQINLIYTITKKQSESNIWFNQRKGRITASKFHQVYTRVNSLKTATSDLNLSCTFKNLLGENHFQSLATRHGVAMEPHAKKSSH